MSGIAAQIGNMRPLRSIWEGCGGDLGYVLGDGWDGGRLVERWGRLLPSEDAVVGALDFGCELSPLIVVADPVLCETRTMPTISASPVPHYRTWIGFSRELP